MIGTFPPTQCGIATFTADLRNAICDSNPFAQVDVFTIKEHPETKYAQEVKHEITGSLQSDYVDAAKIINQGGYDAVSIQHEYGIFGGIAGSFLLDLVWNVNLPIITTLHTVLDKPSLSQKLVLEALLDKSETIVVMSHKAVELLSEVHGINRSKIQIIPHGIPTIPTFSNKNFRLGVPLDSPLILTFGLLSPDKGIQYVIEALPEIIKHQPGATYAIVGATHPHILTHHGEKYRDELILLAESLGVSQNVKFINEFVSLEDLVGYLSAMDIYITPYLKPHQITSGTLAYAVGAGKVVISTPYWYAEELLADGRGILVPFRDSKKLAEAVVRVENSPEERAEMGKRAAKFGESMLWSEVGKSYNKALQIALEDQEMKSRESKRNSQSNAPELNELPSLNTIHLTELSDDTGILQHANHSVPLRSEGYCVDDNARALLFTAVLENYQPLSSELDFAQGTYLSFVLDAFNKDNGRFRNFMDYQRNWLELEGSEDSHGRSVWALGTLINKSKNQNRREVATRLFQDALPAFDRVNSPRTWAYGILGAGEYLDIFPHDLYVRAFMQKLATQLLERYQYCREEDWHWYENSLTYANARLPQALISAGHTLFNIQMLQAGYQSLEWLRLIQIDRSGLFCPVGSNGFYSKFGLRNLFDQQPIEAAASVSSFLTAWKVSGHSTWLAEAHRAFRWFLGGNTSKKSLYDEKNGGCYDGLHPSRINKNQGAESTLSYMIAVTEMRIALFPKNHLARVRATHEIK